tara:strand:- start:510 stop:686 length:177 start_codon:yes stop_codon:yes gene_type:complete
MKKIIESIEPTAIAASGLDEAVMAQASISAEKNITELLGESNEAEDRVSGDWSNNEGS